MHRNQVFKKIKLILMLKLQLIKQNMKNY